MLIPRKIESLLARASAQPVATLLLALVAVGVRLAYFAYADIVRGSDSALYLRIAKSFADGSPETFGFPFHALYGIALAPAELFGIDIDSWVIVLHVALAVATVLLVHRTALFFAGPVGSFFAGLATALLPTATFWSHYVLTETLFVAVLAAFAYLCGRALVDPAARFASAAPLVAAPVLALSRPVGVPVALVGLGFVVWARVGERAGLDRARRAVAVAGLLLLVLVAAILAAPPTREALFSNQTFTVSLWNSTRVWKADIDHVNRGLTLPAELRGLSLEDRIDAQRERAFDYIKDEPAQYAGHAVIRFGSFWMPALTASWGSAHKLYDIVLMLALLGGGLFALLRPPPAPGRRVVLLLAALALTQGLIVAFSQIDNEARYRLPAEIVLVPLIALACDRAFAGGRMAREGQAAA